MICVVQTIGVSPTFTPKIDLDKEVDKGTTEVCCSIRDGH